jgi:hypothetical protein
MQDLFDRFLRFTSGAMKIWGTNLDWADPLYQTVLVISRFKESIKESTVDPDPPPNYIRRSKTPSNNQPTLHFSLLRLPDGQGFTLRIKKEIRETEQKLIRAGLTYPAGIAVVRIRENKNSKASNLWKIELAAQTRIITANNERKKLETCLKNILVPLTISKRENSEGTIVDEIILPYHSKNAEEYLEELKKQNYLLSEQKKNHLILGFAQGISDLHEHVKLAHRDLKLANFMISDESPPTPHLIDWDTSSELAPYSIAPGFRGTKGWLPPEAVEFSLNESNAIPKEENKLEIDPVKWDSFGLYLLIQSVEEGQISSLCVLQVDDPQEFLNKINAMNAEPMPPSNTKEWIKRQLSKKDPKERITPSDALCYLKNLSETPGCIVS